MERPQSFDRLLKIINNAKNNNPKTAIDVSRIDPDGKGSRLVPRRNFVIKDYNFPMNKIIIDNVPLVSNNYDHYKIATDILGLEYHYLADYYLIILEIKKGDREYINDIAEINYPALVSNPEVFNFAMNILGKDYEYLRDYYDLAMFIRDDDYEEVLEYLEIFDPRDDNDFAYHIALQYGDQKYIDLIKNEIIKRDWLEIQALENVLGKNSPYKELHKYMKKLQ